MKNIIMIQGSVQFEEGSAYKLRASLVVKINGNYKTILGLGDTKADAVLWLMDNLTEIHEALQTDVYHIGM
jgi:hypothetical protein